MCLGIPGQVTELLEEHEHLARVDVSGVGRVINIGLLEDEHIVPGDWVLIHVGFAMSKIDELEAQRGARRAPVAGQWAQRRARRAGDLEGHGKCPGTRRRGPSGRLTCVSSTSTATRPPHARWWRGSPRSPATTTSSSWRCAAATRTPSTATASSTCSRAPSSWCTVRAARCASSRWVASTTRSQWRRRPV